MNTEQKCPIWGTAAKVVSSSDAFEEPENGKAVLSIELKTVTYSSPRAGGEYSVGSRITAKLDAINLDVKIKLTDWIVEQNRFGAIPEITSETLERIKSRSILSVFERADRLLHFIDFKTSALGDIVSLFY